MLLTLLLFGTFGLTFSKNLKCHKAENFKLFCGFRRDVHIYADLCMIQPHPDSMEEFEKLPELEECPGSAEDYECFLEMEYPAVTDSFIEEIWAHDMSSFIDFEDIPNNFDGIETKGIKAGCREKDRNVMRFKQRQDPPIGTTICMPVYDDKVHYSVFLKPQKYTCSCENQPCTGHEDSCKLFERRACNSGFQVPPNVMRFMFTRKDELIRRFRRAEEL